MVSFNICCNFSCFAPDALLQLLPCPTVVVVAAMFSACKQLNCSMCVCVGGGVAVGVAGEGVESCCSA